MFRTKTLFVIGAGASAEVGMPVGAALMADISSRLSAKLPLGAQSGGDVGLIRSLLNWRGDANNWPKEVIAAGNQIRASTIQALSIDNILDAFESEPIQLVGKAAIVRSILSAEGASPFFRHSLEAPGLLNMEAFQGTWYDSLTKALCEGIRRTEIGNIFENVEIINFNYDRCLERYLPQSLASYYGLPLADTEHVCRKIRIHRPYGSTGKLPWEVRLSPDVPFGDNSEERIVEIAHDIMTFTEQIEDETVLAKMRKAIEHSERIIFLGFGFHPQNLELLTPQPNGGLELSGKSILATVYRISLSNQNSIQRRIAQIFGIDHIKALPSIDLSSNKCADFMKEHWMTIIS